MLTRTLAGRLASAARKMPVVTLTGPRQSGKTTLVRSTFPGLRYMNLEAPDTRARAIEDPRGFLSGFSDGVVLDEVQRTPDLFSYIQERVDEDGRPGRFILTGSQNFLLLDRISQSLAGRTSVLHLHPFSVSELLRRTPWCAADFTSLPADDRTSDRDLSEVLQAGFYPRIHDQALDPTTWLEDYRTTYVERDVRQIVNIGDLDAFHRFLGLCAGRNGQLLNASSLGNDAGIDQTTVRRWLSVLETSFLVLLLRPHHRNFGKRLIRSPKLYFLDTGLLCSLLGIRTPEDLAVHASRGAIFESFVLSELVKAYAHRGQRPPVFFWRDSAGHEVDFVVENGETLVAFEAKSGETIAPSFFDGLRRWQALLHDDATPAVLVHGGPDSYVQRGIVVRSWQTL